MHKHCILASHDKMTPMKAGLLLAKNMSVNPQIIQNSGHMLPIESPKKTLLALRKFIETIAS
jgi:pimeloyl-ACP methyl ester carboxylesterase